MWLVWRVGGNDPCEETAGSVFSCVCPPDRADFTICLSRGTRDMIRFTCPNCMTVLSSPPGTHGTKVSCATCSQRLLVPPPPPPQNMTILGGPAPIESSSVPASPAGVLPSSILKPIPPPAPLPPLPAPEAKDEDSEIPVPRRRNCGRQDDSRSWKDAASDSPEPHRGVLVMVLGIVGISLAGLGLMMSFLFICFIVFIVAGGVCSLMAWIMGSGDLKKMAKGAMDRRGRTQTQVGYVCGIIGTILAITPPIVFGAILALILLAAGSGMR